MKRQLHFMTRASAFEIPIIGAFIRRVNAFPVERGQADVGALKHAIQIVRAGGGLLIFPEGTRTRDGKIGKIKPGAASIAQKTGGLVVPAAIRGAYAAWPRQKKFPALGRVSIGFGQAIEVGPSKDDLVLATEKLDQEIRRIYEELEEKRPGHVKEF